MAPDLRVYPDAAGAARAAAADFADAFRSAAQARGVFRVLLSGGRTPKALYFLLAGREFSDLPWERGEFFWGDERYLPPAHPDNNYRAANDLLLTRVAVPGDSVYAVPTASGDPARDAARYEQTLRRVFDGEAFPRFDYALMGVGADGHTASLFPGGEAVKERKRWVVPAYAPDKITRSRITLTVPVFNAARRVVFMLCGEDKLAIAERLIKEPPAKDIPASLIRPADGELVYFLDRAASPAA
ncbi:MAG: 6-phosphogluconolactonase [Elusimicrobiota bacterium]